MKNYLDAGWSADVEPWEGEDDLTDDESDNSDHEDELVLTEAQIQRLTV